MRPIDISSFAKVEAPAGLGPAPQLQWIKIADLVVDETYQRPLASQGSRGNIRRIAEKFDWRMFAPVIVSPVEGGRFAIVDGQHRTTAAALRGVETVPCNVILADRQEQASAFKAINGQVTRVTPQQIFKASLASDDETAQRIARVAAEGGVKLLYSNRSIAQMKGNETLALQALGKAVKQHGDDLTVTALRAIAASAAGKPGFFSSTIITAMAATLAGHPTWAIHPQLFDAMGRINLLRAYDKVAERVAGNHTLRLGDLLPAAIVTALDRELSPSPSRPATPKAIPPAPASTESPGARFRALREGEVRS